MFYSQHVLTKKGPLAKIWLAAHMQSKLTKAMVFSTDLRKAVESIISPEVPMALRLTSNLLLGVVRILHRKSKYLLQESSEAMTRLKLAFRSGNTTDLPPRNATTANYNAITLQPSVDTLNAPNLDLDLLPARTVPAQTSFLAADRDITIDEFAGGLVGGMLDAFALEPELERQDEMDPQYSEPLLFTPSQRLSSQDSPHALTIRSDPSHRSELSSERMRADSASAGEQVGLTPIISTGSRDGPPEPSPEEKSPLPVEEEDPEASRRAQPLEAPPPPTLTEEGKEPGIDTEAPAQFGTREDAPPAPETPRDAPAIPSLNLETPEEAGTDGTPTVQPPAAPQLPRLSTGTDDLVLEGSPGSVPDQPSAVVPVPSTPQAAPQEDIPAATATDVVMTEPTTPAPEPTTPAPEPATPAPEQTTLVPEPTTPAPEDIGEVDQREQVPADEQTPHPRRESAEWRPPSTPETPETPMSPAPPHTRPARKRKANVLTDEGATELSASTFRACLNDTSDIIRGPQAPTRRRIDSSFRYTDMLTRPAITLAPALRSLFEQTFHAEELVVSPMSDADLMSSESPEGLEREVKDDEEEKEQVETDTKDDIAQEDQPAEETAKETSADKAPEQPEAVPEPPTIIPEVSDAPLEPSDFQDVPAPPAEAIPEEREDRPDEPAIEESSVQQSSAGTPKPMELVEAPIVEGVAGTETEESRPRPVSQDPTFSASAHDSVMGGIDVGSMGTAPEVTFDPTGKVSDVPAGTLEEDSGKISLREVAITRAQVDPKDKDDVTEATISARTRKMKEYISEHTTNEELNFSSRFAKESTVTRRTVARTFYEILNLSTKKAVSLRQTEPYGDIFVKARQPAFDQLAMAVEAE